MRYLHILWSHAFASEPDETLVELDEDGCEVRVLELCRGQVLGFASREEASPPTELIQVPWSQRDQVGSHPDYEVRAIDGAQFETAWDTRWRM